MLSSLSHLEEYWGQISEIAAPISCVRNSNTEKNAIQWDVIRLDLLDEGLSGNKLFKLIPFLLDAQQKGFAEILSFGGVYSNHLYAVAHAGKRFGFSAIGIVRGYANQPMSETLADVQRLGMRIRFADKQEYAQKYEQDYLLALQKDYPNAYIIPEGGAQHLGIHGATFMAGVLQRSVSYCPDFVTVSTGTGTSFIGMLGSDGWKNNVAIQGYTSLDNAEFIGSQVKSFHPKLNNNFVSWQIFDQYHCGGFAKINSQLAKYIRQFENEQYIPLDPIYTAKHFFGVEDQIKNGCIPKGSKIVSLHTGGLQGMRGMNSKIDRLCAVENKENCHDFI